MQPLEISEPDSTISSELEDEITIGIDFGTTNSLIAISRNKIVEVLYDIHGRDLIPSIIEWNAQGDLNIPGSMRHLQQNSHSNIFSIKRFLGKSSQEIMSDPILFSRVKDFIDLTNEIPRLLIGNKKITFPELAAEIFKYLKEQAVKALGSDIEKIVLTIPAYFDDAAKGAIILAAKIAGLQIIRIIAEPTAAAYAYGLNNKVSGTYLVYDLGGGTFDVSVLNMQHGILQVIAIGGDNMMGGDDIDALIAEYFKTAYNIQTDDILYLAKQAKEYLANNQYYMLNKDIKFDRATLEQIIAPIITRSIDITRATLEQAGFTILEGIILSGGSTRIPIIAKLLQENFKTNIFNNIDADRAVVMGAALQAENLTSSNNKSILIDALPLSLGLELYGGLVEKIILRNSPIPLSVTREFTTHVDNQTAISFHIVQGEREMVADCRSLAKFELKNILPMKAGTARVEVIFTIDVDGILSVSATEKVTNKSQVIEIKPTYGLSQIEIDEILENAYKHAAIDHTDRLLREEILDAKSLISSTKNAIKEMPELLNHQETYKINQEMLILEQTIDNKSRDKIKAQTDKLREATLEFNNAKLNVTIAHLLKGKLIDKL